MNFFLTMGLSILNRHYFCPKVHFNLKESKYVSSTFISKKILLLNTQKLSLHLKFNFLCWTVKNEEERNVLEGQKQDREAGFDLPFILQFF